ncbi:MAG: LolA family protein [Bacteroidia bacterium]|jgi:outer membrane lipoprotein-sorting protein
MYKILFCLSILLSGSTLVHAQNDAKSRDILNKMSKQYRSYSSMAADVSFTIDNPQAKIKEVQKGKVLIKGEKFSIDFGDQKLMTDGKTLWGYLKDMNEVTVSDYEPEPDELSPTTVFTIYEKGFESYYLNNSQHEGVAVHTIDLTPTDKNKPFFKIRLLIDQQKLQIVQAVVFDKNGAKYTYSIKNFIPNKPLTDADFVFNKAKYPGVEVVDMR